MADVLLPLRSEEEKLYVGQPKGFPLGQEFDINNVMLPEGEDLGIESEEDEIDEEEIDTETGFGAVIGRNSFYLILFYVLFSSSTAPLWVLDLL